MHATFPTYQQIHVLEENGLWLNHCFVESWWSGERRAQLTLIKPLQPSGHYIYRQFNI